MAKLIKYERILICLRNWIAFSAFGKMLVFRALFSLIVIITPLNSSAFFGNDLVPGVCAIACGRGGGIVNIGFPGEVFKSVVTGPSIEELDNRLTNQRKELVRDATESLGKVLDEKGKAFIEDFDKKLTEQRIALRSDIERIITEATQELDNVFSKNIELAMNKLSVQEASLIGAILGAFGSLSTLLLYVAATVISMAIVSLIASKRQPSSNDNLQLSKKLLIPTSVIATIFTMAFGASFWANQFVADGAKKGYCNAYHNGDLNRMVYYASKKNTISNDDPEYRKELEIAEIIRDVILRPTLFSDNLKEFFAGPLVDYQHKRVQDGKGRNADVDAVLAVAIWRNGDDRLSEYIAAIYAANSLDSNLDALPCGPNTKPLLRDAAKSVLDAYLMFPISDKDWPYILGHIRNFSNDFLVPLNDVNTQLSTMLSPLGLSPLSLKQLSEIAGKPSHFDQAEVKPSQEKQRMIKHTLRETQLRETELYARTLLLHASAVAETDQKKRARLVELRNNAATEARRLWDQTFERLASANDLSLFIATSRAFHIAYGRTNALLISPEITAGFNAAIDDGVSVCSVSRHWIPKSKGEDAFGKQLDKAFENGLSRIAGRALKLEALIRFDQQSRALYALERILLQGAIPANSSDFYCDSEQTFYELVRQLPDPQLDQAPINLGGKVFKFSGKIEPLVVSESNRQYRLEYAREAAAKVGLFVCETFENPDSCRTTKNWIPLAIAIQSKFLNKDAQSSCGNAIECNQARTAILQRISLPF